MSRCCLFIFLRQVNFRARIYCASLIIIGIIVSGCRSLENKYIADSIQVDSSEDRQGIIDPIELIKKNAQSVNYSDGIDEFEARALVERLILDRYPQFLGWSIKIYSQNDKWMAICRASVHHYDIVEVDKSTGKARYLSNNFANVNFLKEQPSD